MKTHTLIFSILFIAVVLVGCGPAQTTDAQLQAVIAAHEITPLDPGPTPPPALVALGEALFFDKILSGNRDIACATCHHPLLASGDGLALPVGTGGTGLGPERVAAPDRSLVPRNAPDLFNRGAAEWETMFWDGRVTINPLGDFTSPAGEQLPPDLDNILAVQAMFPVTSRDEMRGEAGDQDLFGAPNELAAVADGNFTAIWDGLIVRLLAIPDYHELFAAAYPDLPAGEWGFQHAANALAAYQIAAFTRLDSPWQRYLQGDQTALSAEAKQGGLLFFGEAGCARCHSGPLLSDQAYHVLAVPPVGPGKGGNGGDDGRALQTGTRQQQFAFRTPSLYNVALTGPWMHNGAYADLEAVIAHHLDPAAALAAYDPVQQLPPALQNEVHLTSALIERMLAQLDPALGDGRSLSADEMAALLAFLEALTDPAAGNMGDLVPLEVPSGLPVDGR
jgi:cytochrome c peroxidase